MSRAFSFFLSLMLVLSLGLAEAPRPCIGDGQGNACRPEACACVAACSCQTAHARDRAEAEASCCTAVPTSGHDAAPQAAATCHDAQSWPHFAPAEKLWDALAPAQPVFLAACGPAEVSPRAPSRPVQPSVFLEEPVPRRLA